MAIRAVIYARISKDLDLGGLGVDRQVRDAKDLARRKRWSVGEVFIENDTSASRKRGGKLARRPEFERLCREVEGGHVDAVIGWELDRIFRDPLEQETFL